MKDQLYNIQVNSVIFNLSKNLLKLANFRPLVAGIIFFRISIS